jgi:hypothetical protein
VAVSTPKAASLALPKRRFARPASGCDFLTFHEVAPVCLRFLTSLFESLLFQLVSNFCEPT